MAARRIRRTTRPKSQEGVPLSAVRSAIAEKHLGWEAGSTSLNALSHEERVSRLGLKVDTKEMQATEQATIAANRLRAIMAFAAPPSAVDWRNNGGNFVTPIRDQSNCGSCVSFGTIATIEARANIACRTPGGARDYSEAFLFYCGCGNCCGTGWNFAPALDFCKNTGVAAEAKFPYTPGNQACKAGVTADFKISGYATALSVADRKSAIAERGPVVAGMAVYSDFFSYQSGVYRHATGALEGYHAVSVIGYDDAQGCWIAKNSWGAGWGDSGFFRIAYGECGMDTQFAFFEPQVPCPGPGPSPDDCRRYLPHLKRVLEAARQSPRLRACLRYYVCGRGRRPSCTAAQLRIVITVARILKRCPRYRQAFCRALG